MNYDLFMGIRIFFLYELCLSPDKRIFNLKAITCLSAAGNLHKKSVILIIKFVFSNKYENNIVIILINEN